jgi:hypothetical protein
LLLLFKSGKISLVFNKQKMSPGENQESRNRRHAKETFQRGALMSALTLAVIGLVVKYIPNNFTSEPVKPPTTTEQAIDTTNNTSQAIGQELVKNK